MLDSLSGELVFLLQDNIHMMYDIHAEYSFFLENLRWNAFAAAAAEQDALRGTIVEFVDIKEDNSANTAYRLNHFAGMMPESRVSAGINQNLVDFAVMPFDFMRLEYRDDPTFEQFYVESAAERFHRYRSIALWVTGSVFTITLLSSFTSRSRRKRKTRGAMIRT